jgi:cell division protein ZapA
MADIELTIAGSRYSLACADGEEDRLRALGALVAEQVEAARAVGPGMSDTRALLFAALYLADQLESERQVAKTSAIESERMAAGLASTTQRLEKMTQRLTELGDQFA